MKFDTFWKNELKRDPKLAELCKKTKKIEKILDKYFGKDDSDKRIDCVYELAKKII